METLHPRPPSSQYSEDAQHDLESSEPVLPSYADKISLMDVDDIRPAYSCSVSLSSCFLMKREYDTITIRTPRRSWRRVHAELRGTMLLLRVLPSRPHQLWNRLRERLYGTDTTSRRHATKAYTLQGGEAGIATDYGKQPFVIRVRAEAEQFLLSASTLSTMLEWVDKLSAAIDISLPLELRRMPKYRTLPPRSRAAAAAAAATRGQGRTTPIPISGNTSGVGWSPVGGYQNQLVSRWSPVEGLQQRESRQPVNLFSFGLPQRPNSNPSPSLCPCSSCGTTAVPMRRTFVDQSQRISTLSTDTAETSYSTTSSIDEDGKWNPLKITASKVAQMDYERRCAKVVSYSSPRRYDWYVKDAQKVAISRCAASQRAALRASS